MVPRCRGRFCRAFITVVAERFSIPNQSISSHHTHRGLSSCQDSDFTWGTDSLQLDLMGRGLRLGRRRRKACDPQLFIHHWWGSVSRREAVTEVKLPCNLDHCCCRHSSDSVMLAWHSGECNHRGTVTTVQFHSFDMVSTLWTSSSVVCLTSLTNVLLTNSELHC